MFSKKRNRTGKVGKFKKLEEVVLPNSKLRFCQDQLQNLNYIFHKKLDTKFEAYKDKSLILARSVTERLVQRLVCGAGMIDPRFSSKYLITNNIKTEVDTKLEYMVRLDALSTPTLYDTDPTSTCSIIESGQEFPPDYARLRVPASLYKTWGEFTNLQGYLRRDKIQAKMVELLAAAASQDVPNSPLQVDESVLCGIPGKVVDAATLYNILKVPSNQHVYYGTGGNVPRFPDVRDFRLAIIDDPKGIKLKVEFLSPALCNICIKVTILLAIGVNNWPASIDFPSRIPLGHPDSLLYYQAAQTGMYLVGFGVQSSAWQMRVPAAECILMNHFSPNSTVRTALSVLHHILDDIDSSRYLRRTQVSYKILNRYIFMALLLETLEEQSTSSFSNMVNWSPMYLSTVVLKLLDKAMEPLKCLNQPNYFFIKANLLINPGHLSEDDFLLEANNVKNYLVRLFDESLMSTKGNEDFEKLLLSHESEVILLHKWRDLINGLLPPLGTRGRRFCFAGSRNRREVVYTQYTTRQLEYIGLLLQNMLKVKQNLLQEDIHLLKHEFHQTDLEKENPTEDVIFIIVTIMDQARHQYFTKNPSPATIKNKLKIKNNYNIYTTKLLELVRKDKEIQHSTFEDDQNLVKIILKWLYKAMDQNKKYIAPILRPYLNTIFTTSHVISYDLDQIKERMRTDELEALGTFSELVNSGRITPAEGLIDSVNKKWIWAKNMLDMVERNTLRLVFVEGREKNYRHILSLPSYQNKTRNEESSSKTLDSGKSHSTIQKQKTLPNRSYFNSIVSRSDNKEINNLPQHENLKKLSPMTQVISNKFRMGEHRGSGDILKTLLSMQKLNMFHEVSLNLPTEDRVELAEFIKDLESTKAKRSLNRKWSSTLPQLNTKGRVNPKYETVQKYTPVEESAGIRIKPNETVEIRLTKSNPDSLLGTCRAARIKEDSNVFLLQDSFRIQSLLNKSESFKY